jgi:Pou domain - N-terminal to homeobox domain
MQGDVGLAMGRLYGNDFSQTTISRYLRQETPDFLYSKIKFGGWIFEDIYLTGVDVRTGAASI